ncbi:MAG: hypothetical protein IKD04_00725 [Clostridia bacterium]|nr:hypothetical protein [Clostridia bacterium]
MKTHFHIENKDFTDYLKITVQDKEYYFCDDLTIEYDDCDTLNVDVELIKAEEYLKIKAKNSFLRLLLNIVKWIFAPLLYFIDNEDGIGLDKGYHSFNPFTITQSLSINSPNEKTVNITYIESAYNKITKKFTPPALKHQENTIINTEQVSFSSLALKREWNTYHIPAFSVIMVVIVLLNWLNFSIFAKVIREVPLYPMSENIGGIIGMSFCSLVMIALLIAYIIVIVKSHKLYKEVLKVKM